MINKELKLKYIKSLKSGGRVPKYLTAWGKLDKQDELDDWSKYWRFRATDPSARSKIAGGWKPGSRNGHVESDEEYTARRTKEEQDVAKKRTRHIKKAADTAHMIETLALPAGIAASAAVSLPATLGGIAGGIVGEKAVDYGLGKLADMTGSKVRTWKDLTDPYIGWSPTLLTLINPGTLLGGGIGAKGALLANKAANYVARMGMPALGYAPNTEYYFDPGYAGMNWFKLNKKTNPVVIELPQTDPLSLITQSERFGEGYKLITLEDLLNLALERIGRKLTNSELRDYIGHRKILLPGQEELLGFVPRNRDFSKEGYFVLEDTDLSEALSNFNKFTDKGTIRTKLGNERYTEKEIQSMLDENGNLKSNVALLRMYPGDHGVSNWYDRKDEISDKAIKYFKTKYDTGALMGILRDNPYDRSGVLVRPEDYEYSFDSFDVALNYLDRALGKKLRNFYKLNPKTTHVLGNNYGQLKRYEEIDFDPEFSELLKSNRGELPDGAAVYANKDNGNLIINYGGKKVGTLRPRTNEEIIKEYKSIIDNLNNKYNLNIDYPKLNKFGKIEWPNIYGILYKQGGAINYFKYKHSKFFKNYVSNNIQTR